MQQPFRLRMGPIKSYVVVDHKHRAIIPAAYIGAVAFTASAIARLLDATSIMASSLALIGFAAQAVFFLNVASAKIAHQRQIESLPFSASPAATLLMLGWFLVAVTMLGDAVIGISVMFERI